MLGVAADAVDLPIVREFFELFKTPWEPAVPGKNYQVVLGTGGYIRHLKADVFLLYGTKEEILDRKAGFAAEPVSGPVVAESDDVKLPIYGRAVTFPGRNGSWRIAEKAIQCEYTVGARIVKRVGYDLFEEIRHLLTTGQPIDHASSPTLELHIALLRELLLESGLDVLEIPPRPRGYDFTCCLTHDVDFFGIRRHRFDRTLAGFLARASFGTVVDLLQGRRSLADAFRNWSAVAKLPFVMLGLSRDFWNPFRDYGAADRRLKSTFFLVPFKGRPGISPSGKVESSRAVDYQASDVAAGAKAVAEDGNEIAVHGIDAWRDADAGKREMRELTTLTGRATAGVRMHWLYFSTDSPRTLEAAGFAYDSTWGYNETVGYRAGTSQAFRLPGTESLMELPLSIMDSALLFRGRMHLRKRQALKRCLQILENARRFGGTVVINWHDRSLAPERLWGAVYEALIGAVSESGAVWFATAQEATDWFRWRRAISFAEQLDGSVASVMPSRVEHLPEATVLIHRAHSKVRPASVEEPIFVHHEQMAVEL